MMSNFFIARPVFANVLALVILLIGGVSLLRLPISQYPDIVPPTVQVTTTYPGASATMIAKTVALPIEQQVNGVPGMLYMQSYSSDSGSYTLTVTFKIGTDPDEAQVLVQNRVTAALAALPAAVGTQGVVVQKRSTAVLAFVTLTSPDGSRDGLYLSNYATIALVPELARVPGVGNVTVFGASQYAMRIWFDPQLLQARGLTPGDVINALQQQSVEVPSGQLGAPPGAGKQAFQVTLNVNARYNDPEKFGSIVVKTGTGAGGQITRLRDVARVDLGAQTYAQDFRLDGRPAVGIGIFQDPSANALNVTAAVEKRMKQLQARFPAGITYTVPFDTTRFVRASIDEVYSTLLETGVLVLAVILLFLRDWRAMMVPATTVPVTIVGAFAAMAALGFGINISTLFALVLAVGIVVDDAIVVVEGATHWIESGLPPREAAGKAMDQLFGPIIGITLVLAAVFVPAAFLPGLTGRMYAQFALVIAATALISAINAVTLKPTQCATWLRPHRPDRKPNLFSRGFEHVYQGVARLYHAIVVRLVAHSGLAFACALLVAGGALAGLGRVPTGFLPLEDQGYLIVNVQLPPGASLERTKAAMLHVNDVARKIGGVDNVLAISGVSAVDNNAPLVNSGAAYVVMKDWSVRGTKENLLVIYNELSKALVQVDEARTLVIPPPSIQGIGNAGGFTMQVETLDDTLDWQRLQGVTDAVLADARKTPGVARPNSSFRADVPQLDIVVDRAKAATLQVGMQDVFDTLASSLGQGYAGQFDRFGHTFQVFVQADGTSRRNRADIERIQVRNAQGAMVPLGSLITIRPAIGPSLVSLYNLHPSSTVLGGSPPGFSTGQTLAAMQGVAARTLPAGSGYEWTAMSYQEAAVGSQMYVVFALALTLVYMVLAAQYESWWLPLAVILAVPLALVGPAAALTALGVANNLYTQIGVILLVALSAKNAILIVEVARERRLAGTPITEAAVSAAMDRLRPILMTSIAFAIGVVPLVIATGAGANARRSIGLTTLTGMISSTVLAVILVPSFFVVFQKLQERRRGAPATAGQSDKAGRLGDQPA